MPERDGLLFEMHEQPLLPKAKGKRTELVERALRAYLKLRRANAETNISRIMRWTAQVNLLMSKMTEREVSEYYAGVRDIRKAAG